MLRESRQVSLLQGGLDALANPNSRHVCLSNNWIPV